MRDDYTNTKYKNKYQSITTLIQIDFPSLKVGRNWIKDEKRLPFHFQDQNHCFTKK